MNPFTAHKWEIKINGRCLGLFLYNLKVSDNVNKQDQFENNLTTINRQRIERPPLLVLNEHHGFITSLDKISLSKGVGRCQEDKN